MRTHPRHSLWLLAILLLAAGPRATGEEASKETGIAPGQRAPAFKLKDQNQQDVALDELLRKGPVALVFYRSAEWCLACQLQLIKLQRRLKDIEASGGQLVGISYDSTNVLRTFADRKKISFPLLSDPGSITIDAYGLRDPNAARGQEGVARHTFLVVDQQGVVRDKQFQAIYDEKPAMESLLKALKKARTVKTEEKP